MQLTGDALVISIVLLVCAVGVIFWLGKLYDVLMLLVTLSAKKKDLSSEYLRTGLKPDPKAPASKIHFPNSMFPEQTLEDYERKNPPVLR